MTTSPLAAPSLAPAGKERGGRRSFLLALPTVPFFAYVAVFLVLPTIIVIVESFRNRDGSFTLDNARRLFSANSMSVFGQSLALSATTAVIGSVVGAVLAYAIVTGSPTGPLRKILTAISSVLAQFGGVMLAFAFIATVGRNGFVTKLLADWGLHMDTTWLFEFNGFVLVYSYFQIPLMVIVFLPALDGIRPQWREATETLGGSSWTYWRRVAGPILAPAFISSLLLLFANAFSAYATIAALTNANTVVPTAIRGAMINEVSDQGNYPQVLALGMIVVVTVVMFAYARLQKRATRWLG
ncbi:ABC transporter permease subunit [Nakamurella silvestris]|nr:ABC transporter permease subunit [Nakamurella silvestris]